VEYKGANERVGSRQNARNISRKVLASIFMMMPETGGRLIGRGEVSIEIEAESQSESMTGGNPASVNEF